MHLIIPHMQRPVQLALNKTVKQKNESLAPRSSLPSICSSCELSIPGLPHRLLYGAKATEKNSRQKLQMTPYLKSMCFYLSTSNNMIAITMQTNRRWWTKAHQWIKIFVLTFKCRHVSLVGPHPSASLKVFFGYKRKKCIFSFQIRQ